MKKVIGILQPMYIPWLGYFEQIAFVDEFIILDDVQYTKQDWRNRNRIKTANGSLMLTVPVHLKNSASPINEVLISYQRDWVKKHLQAIRQSYSKSPYFEPVFTELKNILESKPEKLVDLNYQLLTAINRLLGIHTPLLLSSSFSNKVSEKSNDISKVLTNGVSEKNARVIAICKLRNAGVFYEGKSGANYISVDEFRKHDVEVVFQDYEHPVYPQMHGDFISYLSVIDLIMNAGSKAFSVIKTSH